MKPPLPVGHGQRLCPRGAESLPCPFLTAFYGPGPIERGAGLFAAFLALAEATGGAPGRRGREAPTPQGRGPLAPAPAVVLRAMGPQNAAAPAWPGQPFYALGQPPYGRRRRTGTGEAGPVGWAPGGGGVWQAGGARRAPPAAKQKSAPGAFGPGRALSGRFAPCRRPPLRRQDFPLLQKSIRSSAAASCKQNEPAAPDERRASIIRRKSREVFQLVFPRFFQKRAGVWGRSPQRGPGAEPRQGSPPHGNHRELRKRAGSRPITGRGTLNQEEPDQAHKQGKEAACQDGLPAAEAFEIPVGPGRLPGHMAIEAPPVPEQDAGADR